MKTKLLLLFSILFALKINAQSTAPSVGVNTITAIATTTATVNYAVRTNGTYTTCKINYSLASNMNPVVGQTPNVGFNQAGPWQNASANLSGLTPNTTYYVQAQASNSLGTVNSNIISFTTATSPTPDILAISTSVTSNSANINYTINPKTSAATSLIKYGLSASALNSQLAGFSAPANTNTAGTATLTGLSVNTLYFYQIDATNADGTTSSNIGNFNTNTAEQIIAEYNFNNTMDNINGNSPFAVNSSTFVPGRDSNSQMALQTNNLGRSAIIPNLPIGSAARTVSIWYKVTGAGTNNTLFVYGAAGGENSYGVSFDTANNWYNFAWNTNTPFSNASVDGQWHHLVTTYDSSKTSKVYVDGVLKNTVVQNGWNTSTSGNVFWLAGQFSNSSPFNGAVDDLKIFNYALTQAQVTALYTNATLATTENTIKTKDITIYPNPAKDFVNIQSEKKVQSVEIYNMAGQKVLETKEAKINTSNLKSGVYMVKIKDVENQISSQKLIIK